MLTEKLAKWLEKVQNKKGDIQYFQNANGVWRIHDTREGVEVEVDAIYLRIENDEKILSEMFWHQTDKGKAEKYFKILFKDQKKLIVETDEKKVFGFGFRELETKERVLFVYRISKMLYIMWASSADSPVCQALGVNDIESVTTKDLDSLFKIVSNISTQGGDNYEK